MIELLLGFWAGYIVRSRRDQIKSLAVGFWHGFKRGSS